MQRTARASQTYSTRELFPTSSKVIYEHSGVHGSSLRQFENSFNIAVSKACQAIPTGQGELCQKQQGWVVARKLYLTSLPHPNSDGLFLPEVLGWSSDPQLQSLATHLSADRELIFKSVPSAHLKPVLFHINTLILEINIIKNTPEL